MNSIRIAVESDVERPGGRQPINGGRPRGVAARVVNAARGAFRDGAGAGDDIEHMGKLRRHDLAP